MIMFENLNDLMSLFLQETLRISIQVEGDRHWWKFTQLTETVCGIMVSISIFPIASSDSIDSVENCSARISFEANRASWPVPRVPF